MADDDGVPPTEGVETAPDMHTQPDHHTVPDVHTQPDSETLPDIHTQPDFEVLPDYRPEIPPIGLPDDDGCFPVVSREELEMALRRAQLVMEDCSAVLDPAIRAMEDGAWVSRRADEFFSGLTTHSRLAGSTAERCVETIQEALDARGNDDLVEPRAL